MSKHLENCRIIEGIFYAWCDIHKVSDVSMNNSGSHIYFSTFPDQNKEKSKELDRDILVEMNSVDLARFILAQLNELNCKINLPSRFQQGDRVRVELNNRKREFDPNEPQLTGKILAVHFYPGKVKYDIEIPIADEAPTRIYNIDSCFVFPPE